MQTSAQKIAQETPKFVEEYRRKGFIAGVKQYFKDVGDQTMKKTGRET